RTVRDRAPTPSLATKHAQSAPSAARCSIQLVLGPAAPNCETAARDSDVECPPQRYGRRAKRRRPHLPIPQASSRRRGSTEQPSPERRCLQNRARYGRSLSPHGTSTRHASSRPVGWPSFANSRWLHLTRLWLDTTDTKVRYVEATDLPRSQSPIPVPA